MILKFRVSSLPSKCCELGTSSLMATRIGGLALMAITGFVSFLLLTSAGGNKPFLPALATQQNARVASSDNDVSTLISGIETTEAKAGRLFITCLRIRNWAITRSQNWPSPTRFRRLRSSPPRRLAAETFESHDAIPSGP